MSISGFCKSLTLRFATTWIVITLALHILLSEIACAKVERVDFYKAFQEADAVIIGEIVEAREEIIGRTPCAIIYSISPTRVVKGHSLLRLGDVRAGRTDGLSLRRKYLLFLDYENNATEIYNKIRKKWNFPEQNEVEKLKALEIIKCNFLIPGFIFDPYLAFEVDSNFIAIEGLKPRVPEVVEMKSGGKLAWLVNIQDLLGYFMSMNRKR